MTYFAYAPAISDIYTLTGPDGSVAVLNDPTNANYVGMVVDITGLDGADVRESSEDLTEADGGAHGNFFYGRRPITITGRVFGHTTLAQARTRLDKILRASDAMRGDAVLKWVPVDQTGTFIEMFTYVRRQQPVRITGSWVKDFQVSLVSEYAPLFSTALRSATAANGVTASVENQGSGEAYPIITITGASTNPTVTNGTPSPTQILYTTGLTLVAAESIQIDTLTHTASFTAGARSGQSANRYIDFGLTVRWPRLAAGINSFVLAGGGSMTLSYRDTWR